MSVHNARVAAAVRRLQRLFDLAYAVLDEKRLDALQRHDLTTFDRCDQQLDELVGTFNRIVREAAAAGSV
jgi:hypothetical protein